jgi:nickel/cobalt homeostasis protein
MSKYSIALLMIGLCLNPSLSYAEAKKRWVSNAGLNTPDYYQPTPTRPYKLPHPPHSKPSVHSRPNVSIHYTAPQTIYSNQQQTIWINGQSSETNTQFQHEQYYVVTDWRKLGLPAPPQGMYWIYQQGRYMLQTQR